MIQLTPVVRNLIIINCLIFLAQKLMDPLTGIISLWDPHTEYFRPFQLFTYMFAHGGFLHLFFNMLVLATTGPILENFLDSKRFLIFYMVTGIGAGIFHLIIQGFFFPEQSFIPMLGASGAIYGVLMGFGMMFPNLEVMLLIPPIPIKAKYLVWVLGGMTYLLSGEGVAHFAHLGGIIFAFIMIRMWRSRGGGKGYF